jgi:hypothetical protein
LPTVISHLCSRHSFSLRNANSHETAFIGWAHLSGINRAKSLAARFQWKFQRPLPELLAVIDELDRNCSVQNAKRKRLPARSRSMMMHRSSSAISNTITMEPSREMLPHSTGSPHTVRVPDSRAGTPTTLILVFGTTVCDGCKARCRNWIWVFG